MNIKDKVAIVTGASSGIGLATAKLLSQHGAKVILVARSFEHLKKLSEELPDSLPIKTDMANEEEISQMIREVRKQFGQIDILINYAGQGYDSDVENMNIDTYRKLFDLDVVGPVFAMQQVIPVMKKRGGGTIINISSGTALMFLPGMSAYSSLKRALVGITLTAREELAPDKITVSIFYPYVTLTDFEKNTIKDEGEQNSKMNYDDLPFPPDTASYAAEKILETIKSGEAEVFAHDWMKGN